MTETEQAIVSFLISRPPEKLADKIVTALRAAYHVGYTRGCDDCFGDGAEKEGPSSDDGLRAGLEALQSVRDRVPGKAPGS